MRTFLVFFPQLPHFSMIKVQADAFRYKSYTRDAYYEFIKAGQGQAVSIVAMIPATLHPFIIDQEVLSED